MTGARVTYEYKVIEIREKMLASKVSGGQLERWPNENAANAGTGECHDHSRRTQEGRSCGVKGLLDTFERARN